MAWLAQQGSIPDQSQSLLCMIPYISREITRTHIIGFHEAQRKHSVKRGKTYSGMVWCCRVWYDLFGIRCYSLEWYGGIVDYGLDSVAWEDGISYEMAW